MNENTTICLSALARSPSCHLTAGKRLPASLSGPMCAAFVRRRRPFLTRLPGATYSAAPSPDQARHALPLPPPLLSVTSFHFSPYFPPPPPHPLLAYGYCRRCAAVRTIILVASYFSSFLPSALRTTAFPCTAGKTAAFGVPVVERLLRTQRKVPQIRSSSGVGGRGVEGMGGRGEGGRRGDVTAAAGIECVTCARNG